MSTERIGVGARLMAAVGGVVLVVSLFLTWGSTAGDSFLTLSGATNRRGAFFAGMSKSAWEVYSVADIALVVLAVGVIVAVRLDRRRLLLVALLAAVAGLGFAIDQIGNPPLVASPLPVGIPLRPTPANLPHLFGSSAGAGAGAGETVAVIAVVAMVIGLTAALTSRLNVAS